MVDKSIAVASASPAPAAASEVPVTSRLRELIQQLGEAIHEAVIENEQIAGVVQDIRQNGFDVLLMLEASIALNDLSDKEEAQDEAQTGSDIDRPFSQKDLSFLRQLRISVDGKALRGDNLTSDNVTGDKQDDPGHTAF